LPATLSGLDAAVPGGRIGVGADQAPNRAATRSSP
jgi:hypothetical protein